MTKIAIIEDDQVINQMYRMKFEAAGFDVATASDGQAGISMAAKVKPDIILLDLQMPGFNGLELQQVRLVRHASHSRAGTSSGRAASKAAPTR